MKTPEILLAEATLTWFVLSGTMDDEWHGRGKVLATFDGWQIKEHAAKLYCQMISNALKVLEQNTPKNKIYIKAKKIWETHYIDIDILGETLPPMGAKTKSK
jgi:hypothetical protein